MKGGTIKPMVGLPPSALVMAPAIPQVTMESIATLLPRIKKADGTPIVNYNQAQALAALKFEQGETILTLEDRPFLYEVVNMLNTLDYEVVYNFLNVGWEKVLGSSAGLRHRILFENPLLTSSRDRSEMNMEMYRRKLDIGSGMINCRRCKSQETISAESQRRSADEATNVYVTCLQCNYKWRAQ